jgi:hypothetical protein
LKLLLLLSSLIFNLLLLNRFLVDCLKRGLGCLLGCRDRPVLGFLGRCYRAVVRFLRRCTVRL